MTRRTPLSSTALPPQGSASPVINPSPVAEPDLGLRRRVRPGAIPVGQDDNGEPLWSPEDIEPLETRKGWRKQGRRIDPGLEPARELAVNGEHVRLFALSQTLDETAFLERRRPEIAQRRLRLDADWTELLKALAEWRRALETQSPAEAEEPLRALLRDYHEISEQRLALAANAAKLDLPLPEMDEQPWRQALNAFRAVRFQGFLQQENPQDLELAAAVDRQLIQKEQDHPDPHHLVPYWKFYARLYKRYEEAAFARDISQATRIREFHNLFAARARKRRFTLYLGPTNSGKTFRALQRLGASPDGVYLAPLRLLAQEVAQTLNEWGTPCHLITGEERIEVAGARHTASTIEMLPLGKRHTLCVIDEAQMTADADRGWAWTQAILGVQAEEVCVVGSPESLPVLKKLLALTEEPFTLETLERLTPLKLLKKPVDNFADLQPGTALIAFSRAGVLGLKARMERETGAKAAVIYGALPPEVRREQARLFANGEAPLLVATDAIGMGLNLPIRTLLFCEDRKFVNRQEHPLTPLEVRQIAGRAGRFGKSEVGWVGTFALPMTRIRAAFLASPPPLKRARLAPNLDHLLAIAELQGHAQPQLARLFAHFRRAAKPDPQVFQLADLEDQTLLARIADRHKKLDLATRFQLSAAPVPLRSTETVAAFEIMTAAIAADRSLSLADLAGAPGGHRLHRLTRLETEVRLMDLYCWLHYRFPEIFPDRENAEEQRKSLNQQIGVLLTQTRRREERFSRRGSGGERRKDRKLGEKTGTKRSRRGRPRTRGR